MSILNVFREKAGQAKEKADQAKDRAAEALEASSVKDIASEAKAKFMENHPQVQTFLDNVSGREPEVGQEVAIAVRYPDGAEYN